MSPRSERMSPVDRAWLLMERRTNPMMVVALGILERRLSLPALKRIVRTRLLAYPRFYCRPVEDYLGASWVHDDAFDLDAHVHRVALSKPAAQSGLEELAGELASTPLPNDRPMWSFHLVERYRRGSAFIIRIHHSYADGIALVKVMLGLTDEGAASDAGAAMLTPPGKQTGSAPDGLLESMGAFYQPVSGLIERGVHLLLHPGEVGSATATAVDVVRELAHLATLSDDPKTQLKRELTGTKHVAWAPPLSLSEVHTVAKRLGCTINDVLMSTLAGVLGAYLEDEGDSVDRMTIRAAVPVNLREAGASVAELGNRFGIVFVELPIGERHPMKRLYAMHDIMLRLRESQQPVVVLGLLGTIGSLPAPVEEPAIELFSAKASAVVSNVPGPKQSLSMAGSRITQLMFWVPQSGSIGVGVSMLSYADRVQFGVIADRNLIAEPRQLTRRFSEEFERLVLLTMLAAPPQ